MNCTQAKELSINGFMISQGYTPTIKGNAAWYISPLRPDEKTASFKVDRNTNKWFDFGMNTSGDIVDLVKLLHNTSTIGALLILQEPGLTNKLSSFEGKRILTQEPAKQRINFKVSKLKTKILIDYITNTRKIPAVIWSTYSNYLFEASYLINESDIKPLINIAWKNDLSGYELNSHFINAKGERFKGVEGNKAITTIHGLGEKPSKDLNVFESFIDCLSALTYYNAKRFGNTTIVLNGVGQTDEIVKIATNYRNINCFLDNDRAGIESFQKIHNANQLAVNQSILIHPNHKDFNDFITCK